MHEAELGEGAPARGAPLDVDVSDVVAPDLATIEVLARLRLVARRDGRSIRLVRPCPALEELIELAGLREILGAGEGAGDRLDDR